MLRGSEVSSASIGLFDPVAAVARMRWRIFTFSKNRFVTFAESSVCGALQRRQKSIPLATTTWH